MAFMENVSANRFVPLTRLGDLTLARLYAARLRAEGIEVRVHSEALGPYPMTVGQMAQSELWVPEDRIEEASTILLDVETKEALGGERRGAGRDSPFQLRLAAAGIVVVLALAVVLRLMRVF